MPCRQVWSPWSLGCCSVFGLCVARRWALSAVPASTEPADSPCLWVSWSLPICLCRQHSPWAGSAHPCLRALAYHCLLPASHWSSLPAPCPSVPAPCLLLCCLSMPTPHPLVPAVSPTRPCLLPVHWYLLPARRCLLPARALTPAGHHGHRQSRPSRQPGDRLLRSPACRCVPSRAGGQLRSAPGREGEWDPWAVLAGAHAQDKALQVGPARWPWPKGWWLTVSLPGGQGLEGLRCLCAGRVPLEKRKAGSEGRRVLGVGCWCGSGKGMTGVMAGRCKVALRTPCLSPALNPLTALLRRVPMRSETLGAVCAMCQVAPQWCWTGQKSFSSLSHLTTVCPTPFWLISPHPGSHGTRAEVLPRPTQGKSLTGTTLPRDWTLSSSSGFPLKQQCSCPLEGSRCLRLE